jgi:hypothetical protein
VAIGRPAAERSVVEVGGLVVQVPGGLVGLFAFGLGELRVGDPPSNASSDLAGVSLQHGHGPVRYPVLGGGVALGEEASHRAQRYSRTWTRSTTMVTLAFFLAAWAWMQSMW